MRKLSIFILAILLLSGIAYAGSTEILGQGGFQSDPHRIYRMVRFVPASGSVTSITLSAEAIVIWDTTSDDGVTITTSTTTGDAAVAGVVPVAILTPEYGSLGASAANEIGRRNWGFVQTYGYAKVTMNSAGAAVVNTAIGTSAAATQAGQFGTGTTANGRSVGFALDSASGASVEVFLVND